MQLLSGVAAVVTERFVSGAPSPTVRSSAKDGLCHPVSNFSLTQFTLLESVGHDATVSPLRYPEDFDTWEGPIRNNNSHKCCLPCWSGLPFPTPHPQKKTSSSCG